MAIKNVVLLNKDNLVLATLSFDDSDPVDFGTFSGLLSNPEFIEIDLNSQVGIGWKYTSEKTFIDG